VRLAAPALAATAVTGTVVGVVVAADIGPDPQTVAASKLAGPVEVTVDPDDAAEQLDLFEDRSQRVSRSARRVTLDERPEVVAHRFTTEALNLRTKPSEDAKKATTLDFATRIGITGERRDEWVEVVWDRHGYWAHEDFLVKKKPQPPEPEPAEAQPEAEPDPGAVEPVGECTAAPPSGVTGAAMAVYEAVCSRFPSITTYGGWRGDGEHSTGQAVDIMVSGDLGWQVAEYLRANASTFGLYDIIYSQRIWTADRSAEGWRWMEDRGSTTANHYDHVHVKVY
jgi:hypothetical protein